MLENKAFPHDASLAINATLSNGFLNPIVVLKHGER